MSDFRWYHALAEEDDEESLYEGSNKNSIATGAAVDIESPSPPMLRESKRKKRGDKSSAKNSARRSSSTKRKRKDRDKKKSKRGESTDDSEQEYISPIGNIPTADTAVDIDIESPSAPSEVVTTPLLQEPKQKEQPVGEATESGSARGSPPPERVHERKEEGSNTRTQTDHEQKSTDSEMVEGGSTMALTLPRKPSESVSTRTNCKSTRVPSLERKQNERINERTEGEGEGYATSQTSERTTNQPESEKIKGQGRTRSTQSQRKPTQRDRERIQRGSSRRPPPQRKQMPIKERTDLVSLRRRRIRIFLASAILIAVAAAAAVTAVLLIQNKETSQPEGPLSREVDTVLQETVLRQSEGLQELYDEPTPGPEVGMWHYSNAAVASYWLNQTTNLADATFQTVIDTGLFQKRLDNGQFHWLAYQLERIYFLFSSQSKFAEFRGRMSSTAEDNLLEMLWNWSYPVMNPAWADHGIGFYWESENHHAQKYVSMWGAAHIFKDNPVYKDRTFRDGSTPSQMAAAFDDYFKEYTHVYTFRGLTMEVASPTYAKYILNTWYNLYDFAEDGELKAAVSNLLNVYWANWALESIDGIRGGSRHRSYPKSGKGPGGPVQHAWYLFGEGPGPNLHPGAMSAATTFWRPARVVVALALDVEGRGSYAYKSRRLGLLAPDKTFVDLNGGSLLRYSWCTPDFVMGVSQVEARSASEWAGVSSQNRWNGVIFADNDTARIYTQRPIPDRGSVYNAEWAVQYKGAMILQRLTQSRAARGQMLWFDHSLNGTEVGDWIFGTTSTGYAAVKIVRGGWTWRDNDIKQAAGWADLEDQFSPIVMEIARRADYKSMKSFQTEILSNPLVWDGPKLEYTSRRYDNVTLTLFTDESASPQVNGETIDFKPVKVYDSPYLEGTFGTGPVTVRYENFRTLEVR